MKQFEIRDILQKNKVIPVVTIHSLDDVVGIVENLVGQNISSIEVTLRTPIALKALELLKRDYSNVLDIGVGTVINKDQLKRLKEIGVDFIVSPGLISHLYKELQEAQIPFIPGVVTPSEVIDGINMGYDTFKLFPAEIVGGVKLLKTYAGLFPGIKFCPTGGINEKNYKEYLELPNVICVGGSWVI
jgi:2-dehydro-3-deoxyphosphogluconate aldolase/(4S)-4-hydroxy-2-oxoglutarate aldolase